MKTIYDLKGLNYFTCTACMSIWADALSWCNANLELVTKDISKASNIILLSCQVTDLAVLHDFKTAERLRDENPDKNIFISGCLAQRKDIELPEGVERLEQMRTNYQPIEDKTLVNFEKPFWIKDFTENIKEEFSPGNIFRNKYPLRIGKGCPYKCTYCTIRITRGSHEKYDIDDRIIKEFMEHDDVLLIADSPLAEQIKDWCKLAIEKNKKISIRNIEPKMAVQCKDELIEAAKKGVIDIFHSPIQSNCPNILSDMGRDVNATMETIKLAEYLKKEYGVKIATNIIIDYKDYVNDFGDIYKIYDYISWNPLWDGKWDREKAELRFKKYLY